MYTAASRPSQAATHPATIYNYGGQRRWFEMGMLIMPKRTSRQWMYPYRYVSDDCAHCAMLGTRSLDLSPNLCLDRDLVFVPKKGRPITQCQHCRGDRKKRSAHVKCDCGDKQHSNHKCGHLKDGYAVHGGHLNGELDPLPEDYEYEETSCCCPHGGKCTCSTIKKELGDDSASASPTASVLPSRSKPRLTSAQSDGHLTVFANGHHKPVHRNNNAAHEYALPYKMPRAHTDHSSHNIARRSVDSLTASNASSPGTFQKPFTAPVFSIPTSQAATTAGMPSLGLTNSMPTSYEQQPMMNYTNLFGHPSITSMPSSVSQDYGFNMSQGEFIPTTDFNGPSTTAWSVPASEADSNQHIDDAWNQLDWGIPGDMNANQPTLTNASSGSLSEVDELPPLDDTSSLHNPYIFGNSQPPFVYDNRANDLNMTAGQNNTFGLDQAQRNRWSLPTSLQGHDNFGIKNDAAPGTMTDSRNLPFNVTDFANGRVPAFGVNASLNASPTFRGGNWSDLNNFSSSRPRAIYQRSNDMPDNVDWEKMLQQNQVQDPLNFNVSGITSMNDMSAANSSPVANVEDYSNGSNIDNFGMPGNGYDLDSNVAAYQPNNGSQMSQDYLNTFNFDADFPYDGTNGNYTSNL